MSEFRDDEYWRSNDHVLTAEILLQKHENSSKRLKIPFLSLISKVKETLYTLLGDDSE